MKTYMAMPIKTWLDKREHCVKPQEEAGANVLAWINKNPSAVTA